MSLGKAQEEFMRLARVARVATTRADGEPHAVPICPVLEDEKLSFATEADSAKVRNIRAVPRVAVLFELSAQAGRKVPATKSAPV